MTLAIPLASLFAGLATNIGGTVPSEVHLARALEVLGVDLRAASDEVAPLPIVIPGHVVAGAQVAAVAVDEVAYRPFFHPLPDPYRLAEQEPSRGFVDSPEELPAGHWSRRLPVPYIERHQESLVLRVEAGQDEAFGAIDLALPQRGGFREALVLRSADSGCAMQRDFELPIALSSDPVRLSFVWDLHDSLDPTGRAVLFETSAGNVASVPIVLEAERPLSVSQRVLDFGAADGGVLSFEVVGRTVRAVDFETGRECACVEVVDVTETERGFELALRETAAALGYHVCNDWIGMVHLADDPFPWQFRVTPLHERGVLKAEDGTRVINGLFIPEERVEVFVDHDRRLHLARPDRLPGAEDLLRAAGYRYVTTLRVPLEAGEFRRTIRLDGEPLEIRGRVAPELNASLSEWLRVMY